MKKMKFTHIIKKQSYKSELYTHAELIYALNIIFFTILFAYFILFFEITFLAAIRAYYVEM